MRKIKKLEIKCTAIDKNGRFREENTGRGADVSPEFRLRNLPDGTTTLAVVLEDTSHPLFDVFPHWVAWNIPAGSVIRGALPAGRHIDGLDGAFQGLAYGWFRYAGPKPPHGQRHTYRFTVYALDSVIDVPFPWTRREFVRSAGDHILQTGTVEGVFE